MLLWNANLPHGITSFLTLPLSPSTSIQLWQLLNGSYLTSMKNQKKKKIKSKNLSFEYTQSLIAYMLLFFIKRYSWNNKEEENFTVKKIVTRIIFSSPLFFQWIKSFWFLVLLHLVSLCFWVYFCMLGYTFSFCSY